MREAGMDELLTDVEPQAEGLAGIEKQDEDLQELVTRVFGEGARLPRPAEGVDDEADEGR